jgi:serine/threonine protein kinase/tetratricopeptide (TPR) repeat protein
MKCPKCQTQNPSDSKYCKECSAPLTSSADNSSPDTETLEAAKEELTTGTTFARRYQIIEELGKGGMGKVYKAHDTEVREKVALKLIKPDIAEDKKTIERFRNELKLARKIRHKNVCQMYDLNKEEGAYFITMEYVPGEDLKSMIRMTGQLSVGASLNIVKQVCAGLAEAHKLGVIHRDLKPQNIMIDREGDAHIMDFGIARSLKGKGITGSGVMIGTPEYMSPEQIEGKEVDQRSDIYSLGIILYEMLTAKVPFEGDTPFSIGLKHKSEIPKNPKEFNTQIPDDLSRVILKCLDKDVEKRFQSAGELRSELTRIEKGIPSTERIIPKGKPITSKEITVTFRLKKLLIPALILIAIVTAAVIVWQFLLRKESVSPLPEQPSIAVLPFVDLSPQEDQAYFCDGLADELINRLSRIDDLRVPARTSVFSFKGKELDIREIGKKLEVETVLEGSVRKAGDKLRITVQLVKVDDGYPLWSEKYDRSMEDIFALQDEISLAIVDNLKIELLGKEKQEFIKGQTQNLEAYDSYLKGRYFWNKRTVEDIKKSVEYFQQAIEKDPAYALAYAGLADSYITLGDWQGLSPKEAFPEARKAAEKALEIDDLLAEAHNSLAYIKYIYEWDWPGAEKAFKLAITLNPNYATAHQWYAEFLTIMGRFDEALKEIKRAQELDPLSLIINAIGGWPYIYSRKYDQAIEHFQKTLEMDPDFRPARSYLGRTYIGKGRYKEALREYEILNDLNGIGLAYAKMGKIKEAQQVLNELIERSKNIYVPPSRIAFIYFALGDNDTGFEWLEKEYEERGFNMTRLKVHPEYDIVRSDPRFQAWLKKMNLD